MNKNRLKIELKIKKQYKEKMENEDEKTITTTEGYEKIQKKEESNEEEDFSWIKEKNSDLINQYLKFPFEDWKKIIVEMNLKSIIFDKTKIYQESCCKVLENDIFKNEKFLAENNIAHIDIFPHLLKERGIPYNKFLFDTIKPDFIVLNVTKDNFLKIFNFRDYMFRYDSSYNNLQNIESINIIGELKTNIDNIKNDQKNKYLVFCEYANLLYKKTEYFFTLIIADYSFKKFTQKNFFMKKPIILGYIPKLFNDKNLEIFYELKNEEKNQLSEKNLLPEKFEVQNIVTEQNNINKNINNINEQIKNGNNNKKNYAEMSKEELIVEYRKKEDKMINYKRLLEDEQKKYEYEKYELENQFENENKNEIINKKKKFKKFEENMKLLERSKEDLFLGKKREIEDIEFELEKISNLLNKHKKI